MERFCRIHYFIDVKYLINGSANKPHVKGFKQILHGLSYRLLRNSNSPLGHFPLFQTILTVDNNICD